MNLQNQDLDLASDIAMWGPTGSGKTWLYKAFAKELEWYRENDPNFDYELTDEDRVPISPRPPEIRPTADVEDIALRFRRIARKEDRNHLISAHSHRINIQDDQGGILVASVIDNKGFEEAYQKLIKARYVIVVLDSTCKQARSSLNPKLTLRDLVDIEAAEDDLPELAQRGSLSPDEYRQLVQNLLHMLASKPPVGSKIASKRYIAICMTKIDMKRMRDNPWSLLGRIFGEDMVSIVRSYDKAFTINVFATSAVGYYRDIDGKRSNYDQEIGAVKFEKKWEPYNAAAPFFWIFENNEIERLAGVSGREKYIGYHYRPT